MKLFIKILIILSLLCANSVVPNELKERVVDGDVWGQVVKSDTLSTSGMKYYVIFQDDNSPFAYPIRTNKIITTKHLDQFLGKTVRIKGKIKKQNFFHGELRKPVAVIEITRIEALSIKELGIQKLNINPTNKQVSENKKERKNSGGITINDDVANTLIFIGGASILGKIIYDSVKGK